MIAKLVAALATLLTATAIVHCGSSRDPADPNNSADASPGDASDVAVTPEAAADVAPEEPLEIPDAAVVCDASPCAVALSAADSPATAYSFCALMSDRTVQCWGTNLQRKLGVDLDSGTPTLSASPVRVEGLHDVAEVSVGGDNACARLADGSIYCWGAPALVAAGVNPDAGAAIVGPALPTRQDLVPPAESIAVGSQVACIKTHDGGVSCWGNNTYAQLGRRTIEEFLGPTPIALGERAIVDIVPSVDRVFARTAEGSLLSWGRAGGCDALAGGPCYRLGRDTSEDADPSPAPVFAIRDARSVSGTEAFGCAVTGKDVSCWGDNEYSELARGSPGVPALPAPSTLASVVANEDRDAGAQRTDVPLQTSSMFRKTCAVMGSGRVYCWDGSAPKEDDRGRPARVEGLSGPAVHIVVTRAATCALLRAGAVECWGTNRGGALGRGIADIRFVDPNPGLVVFTE